MNEKSKFRETKYFAKLYKELALLDACMALSFLKLWATASYVSLPNSMGFSSFLWSERMRWEMCVFIRKAKFSTA